MGVRVLGIDPGSSATGWALVIAEGNRYHLEASGVLRPRGSDRERRLADLYRSLKEVVATCTPDCAVVESSFSGRNPKSGLALAECRGVILAVLGCNDFAITSYTPAEIKSAIVGNGRAEKQQIVFMVVRLLKLIDSPPTDAADAMAAALTHIHLGRWGASR
ncbi:MAG: crossover junction endodeoxyribonuclease RuvC [Acidobacteriota bacterium]|nr:crossover junction endodeoxyribonuclease RuvC [Acidobacteriota bacterium]